MSAFIVSETCMHRCVQAISLTTPLFAAILTQHGNQQRSELGRLLYGMNAAAVADRYPHMPKMAEWGGQMVQDYRFAEAFPLGKPMVLFKALICLRYQCSEGELLKLPLYAELSKIIAQRATVIVCNLAEYDAAPWDE